MALSKIAAELKKKKSKAAVADGYNRCLHIGLGQSKEVEFNY